MVSVNQDVVTCGALGFPPLIALLARYGLGTVIVLPSEIIPGSFWGDREAGLIGDQLYLRSDTPIHSAFHEACHWICMDSQRRTHLHTDAGGEIAEENGVCYLQILLADYLPGYGRERMMQDMDKWGYTFRLGSAKAWFSEDAEDARQWLLTHSLLDNNNHPLWQPRP